MESTSIEKPNTKCFPTWEWLFSWWSIYRGAERLRLITAWRGTELAGIAPFMLEKKGKFGIRPKVLTSLGIPQSDIGGFIYRLGDSAVVDCLLTFLANDQNEWDMIEFHEFLASSPEHVALMQKFPDNRSQVIEEINQHYYLSLEGNWESYQKSLPKKFRYNLGRAVRLAEEMGPVECKQFVGGDMNEDVIQTIVDINRYSHYPRLYDLPLEQAFIKTLALQMKQSGWFGAYLLFVSKQPVAYEYGFHFNGRFEDWRAGFDPRLSSNISVGKALAKMVIQASYDRGNTEVDFLRGDEPYKLEWKPAARDYANTRVFNLHSLKAMVPYQWLTNIKPCFRKFKSGK